MPREGNNPKRRVVRLGMIPASSLRDLAGAVVYVGSALHKRTPGNYGFQPPTNPRPHKSLCDGKRQILLEEASALLVSGVMKGMVSSFDDGGAPKYIWSVDDDGEAYEAKIGLRGYHGYRLEDDDEMRAVVLREWALRSVTA